MTTRFLETVLKQEYCHKPLLRPPQVTLFMPWKAERVEDNTYHRLTLAGWPP
jgi:hypothetical protein